MSGEYRRHGVAEFACQRLYLRCVDVFAGGTQSHAEPSAPHKPRHPLVRCSDLILPSSMHLHLLLRHTLSVRPLPLAHDPLLQLCLLCIVQHALPASTTQPACCQRLALLPVSAVVLGNNASVVRQSRVVNATASHCTRSLSCSRRIRHGSHHLALALESGGQPAARTALRRLEGVGDVGQSSAERRRLRQREGMRQGQSWQRRR